MDEFTSDILNAIDEGTLPEADDHDDGAQQGLGTDSAKKARRLRNGIFRAASLQDKLLEKLLSQVIPADGGHGQVPDLAADDMPAYAERPGFSVALMSNNFRRFNARIGVVFKFQARVLRVLSWRRPTHTLSLLAVYTFVCLDPYLLLALPLAIALFGILVPSFVARHPAPSSDSDRVRNLGYSPRGPPLAPARTVKPAKELSRDFFRNMGDLQNVMEDFSVAHDKVVTLVLPKTNFSDEALSSALFTLLFAVCVVMMIAGHLLPLRFLALVGGWAAIWSGHPTVIRWIHQAKRQYTEKMDESDHSSNNSNSDSNPPNHHNQQQQQQQQTQKLKRPLWNPAAAFDAWVRSDILLDDAPETREVEIFELQRLGAASGEWEAWLFSPSPYDPLSAARLTGERPRGTRFFEDVLPPDGWEWSEKKWALDLWSREWVEERIITGVEVETEGERWVYDMWNVSANSGCDAADPDAASPVRSGNLAGGSSSSGRTLAPGVSWEEGEEGMGRRGEWRRRRWVRMVKRKKVGSS
ncbi:Peroxisomal membrane protein PEX29 [Madurella mycetomatis]|uniref:Peroxisomal membrane protein PEX29 n=1 Tax=Madurella mycetomatis TaxID=100816 RepID=A0A175VZ69_9PEZI|nr:Peroxisomal membrane protein PEX29 [Madurella mycetomatis]